MRLHPKHEDKPCASTEDILLASHCEFLIFFGSCIVHGNLSAVRCNDDEQISNTLFLNSLEEMSSASLIALSSPG